MPPSSAPSVPPAAPTVPIAAAASPGVLWEGRVSVPRSAAIVRTPPPLPPPPSRPNHPPHHQLHHHRRQQHPRRTSLSLLPLLLMHAHQRHGATPAPIAAAPTAVRAPIMRLASSPAALAVDHERSHPRPTVVVDRLPAPSTAPKAATAAATSAALASASASASAAFTPAPSHPHSTTWHRAELARAARRARDAEIRATASEARCAALEEENSRLRARLRALEAAANPLPLPRPPDQPPRHLRDGPTQRRPPSAPPAAATSPAVPLFRDGFLSTPTVPQSLLLPLLPLTPSPTTQPQHGRRRSSPQPVLLAPLPPPRTAPRLVSTSRWAQEQSNLWAGSVRVPPLPPPPPSPPAPLPAQRVQLAPAATAALSLAGLLGDGPASPASLRIKPPRGWRPPSPVSPPLGDRLDDSGKPLRKHAGPDGGRGAGRRAWDAARFALA
ncbi:hypothetical protein HK405_007537 [Cladochytrium tenue]|nr:hypothetical protein HK405_007537 [Cladochytrium tenue]